MEPWQKRVINEKTDLDQKITKLEDFLCMITDIQKINNTKAVSGEDRILVEMQLSTMRIYSFVLAQRITRF